MHGIYRLYHFPLAASKCWLNLDLCMKYPLPLGSPKRCEKWLAWHVYTWLDLEIEPQSFQISSLMSNPIIHIPSHWPLLCIQKCLFVCAVSWYMISLRIFSIMYGHTLFYVCKSPITNAELCSNPWLPDHEQCISCPWETQPSGTWNLLST